MRRSTCATAARVTLTLAAVSTLAGCASKADIRDLQMEIRDLAVRQDSLLVQLRREARAEARSTQDTLRTQGTQIVDLRGEIMRQLRDITEGVNRLQALVGENQRTIAGVRDQLANQRRATPQQPPAGPTPTNAGATDASAQSAIPGAQQAIDPRQLYQAAVNQFNATSYSTARAGFQDFLNRFPNHVLAPEVHYYLAQILVIENKLEDALAAFQQIQTLFPTSAKVPDALYRAALVQIDLGRTDDARQLLQRVINTYPDTAVASLAKDKLAEIG